MAPVRQLRVGGVWLRYVGAVAEHKSSRVWPHGSELLSWRMDPRVSHRVLNRGGVLVEEFTGTRRTWLGKLTEPTADGEYAARGLWSEAAGVYAVDSDFEATGSTTEAISEAIDRGALTWILPADTPEIVWGTPTQPIKLVDLLDNAHTGASMRWWVDADGVFRTGYDPTVPNFVVPRLVAGRGLTLAEDTYFSHLLGKYFDSSAGFPTVLVGDAAAAAEFGYQERVVDLTAMGVIDEAAAISELQGRLALTGARLGWAENLNLGYGQITNPGGRAVALSTPQAGHMVQLAGVRDRSRPGVPSPNTNIVIARDEYVVGAPTVLLEPMGKAPRDYEALAISGAAA